MQFHQQQHNYQQINMPKQLIKLRARISNN